MYIADTLAVQSTSELFGVSIEEMLVVESNMQGEDIKCRRL
jgi:hypothetical protein